jgi:YbgC/YbaW family acyl-CoA thioester hydrolase
MDISKFKHKTNIKVRTFDVDAYGIVHNSVYLKYLETGRIEYRKNQGYKLLKNARFNDGLKMVVVNNTIDYRYFGFVDDNLELYTRIKWIKNSSFCFEQIIINPDTNKLICEGRGVIVNLNQETNLSEKLPDKFIEEIKKYDELVEIIK